MFVFASLAILVVTFSVTNGRLVPLLAADSKTAIPDQYIVVFNEYVQDSDVQQHHILLSHMIKAYNNTDSNVMSHFHIGTFRGYSAKLNNKLLHQIQQRNEIKYIERNQLVRASCNMQISATWGIVRTTYRDQPTAEDYSYDPSCSGEGVDVYVIDTGIDTSHPDFSERAEHGVDFVDNPSPETDLNGHGTHCAGTVMSDTWGVAKKATAFAVRVLDQNGSGSTSGVISGVNWVANQHSANKKSVANMSLGGSKSTALNNAVIAAVNKGVHMAIAAGNEYKSSCNYSPASACENSDCITTGASDIDDKFAFFSNGGKCVDVIAPGVAITSTWLNHGINTISGTSMAAPHVAGVMAKILSCEDLTPAQMKTRLIDQSSKDKITDMPGDTNNLLLFKSC